MKQLVFESILPISSHPAPIVLLLGLATRIREKFPQMSLSSHWLVTWARATIAHLTACSAAAHHIDDPLTKLDGLIRECLANDPPATRRTILRALAQVHANEEALAAALDPHGQSPIANRQ